MPTSISSPSYSTYALGECIDRSIVPDGTHNGEMSSVLGRCSHRHGQRRPATNYSCWWLARLTDAFFIVRISVSSGPFLACRRHRHRQRQNVQGPSSTCLHWPHILPYRPVVRTMTILPSNSCDFLYTASAIARLMGYRLYVGLGRQVIDGCCF